MNVAVSALVGLWLDETFSWQSPANLVSMMFIVALLSSAPILRIYRLLVFADKLS